MNGHIMSHQIVPSDADGVAAKDDARQSEAHDLGVHLVSVDPEAIRAFCDAAHIIPGENPPFAYPIIWLAGDAIKAKARALIGPDFLPVQESQSFDYESVLTSGETYRLTVLARREATPSRLIVEGIVTTMGDHRVLTLRSVLRLVSINSDLAARSPS